MATLSLSLSYFTMIRGAMREFMPDVIPFHWANPFPASVLLTMIPKDVKLIIHWHMDIVKQAKDFSFYKTGRDKFAQPGQQDYFN